jgi:hypothetical protein
MSYPYVNDLPLRSGRDLSSRFLEMLKRDELCFLSFFKYGGPVYFILLIAVGGGVPLLSSFFTVMLFVS